MKQSNDDVLLFLNATQDFTKYYKKISDKYDIYSELVNKCDKATQDILHNLELNKLSRSEKSKLMTMLTQIRRERRFYKDKIEAVDEILKNTPDTLINKLCNLAGNANKFYKNRDSRVYHPRIIKEEK